MCHLWLLSSLPVLTYSSPHPTHHCKVPPPGGSPLTKCQGSRPTSATPPPSHLPSSSLTLHLPSNTSRDSLVTEDESELRPPHLPAVTIPKPAPSLSLSSSPHSQLSILLSRQIKTLSLPASLPSHVIFFPAPCHSSHRHPGISCRQAFSRQDSCE